MQSHAHLGPEVPRTAADTVPVVIDRWSALDTPDKYGRCVVLFLVRSRLRSSQLLDQQTSSVLLAVTPEGVVDWAGISELNGVTRRVRVPVDHIPGVLRDLAVTRARELFPMEKAA